LDDEPERSGKYPSYAPGANRDRGDNLLSKPSLDFDQPTTPPARLRQRRWLWAAGMWRSF